MPRSPCSRRTLRPSLATAVAVMRVLLKLPAAIGDTVEHTQRRWLNPGRCRNALRIIYHNPNPVAPLSKSDPDSLLHFAWCIFIDAADPPTMFKCSTVLLIAIFVAVNAQYDASESSFESWRAKYQVVYKAWMRQLIVMECGLRICVGWLATTRGKRLASRPTAWR